MPFCMSGIQNQNGLLVIRQIDNFSTGAATGRISPLLSQEMRSSDISAEGIGESGR